MIDLNPGPVARAAANLHAQQAGSGNKIKLDDPVAVGEAHPGWAASSANGPCVRAWRDRLHELGKAAREASEALGTSMDDYVDTDRSVTDAMATDAAWLLGA